MGIENIVIIGAGQAGIQAATSLRDGGFEGSLTILGDEIHMPYQRPPLSKAFLLGKTSQDNLNLRPASFYQDKNITLRTGQCVVCLNRAEKTVLLNSGESLAYDRLILATGSRNRTLPLFDPALKNVFYLRGIDDANGIRAHLKPGAKALVVGAGFIGLEFAAVATSLGIDVTLIEIGDRLMERAVTFEFAKFCENYHVENGIHFVFNDSVAQVHSQNGLVESVETADQRTFPVDMVLIGIGAIANDDVAAEAGLKTENGIIIDARLRTSDPSIYAVGDCATWREAEHGRFTRLESVQNATDQGRFVAKQITGESVDYDGLPWFWSDQGALKIQIAGLTGGSDKRVCRIQEDRKKATFLSFRNGQLIGVETINNAKDHAFSRRILASGKQVTLADIERNNFDLKSL